MIQRKIFATMLMAFLLITANFVSAEDLDDYELDDIMDVSVTKVLTCTNQYTGEVDHTV